MSADDRLKTGFQRIGLVLSAPVALVGFGCCVAAPFQGWQGGSFFLLGVAIIAMAITLYVACWAIGWIVRGFVGR